MVVHLEITDKQHMEVCLYSVFGCKKHSCNIHIDLVWEAFSGLLNLEIGTQMLRRFITLILRDFRINIARYICTTSKHYVTLLH